MVKARKELMSFYVLIFYILKDLSCPLSSFCSFLQRYPMAKLLKAHRWAAKTRYGFPEKSSVQGGLGRVSYGWPESQFGSLGWILLWTFVCIGNRLKRKHGQRKEKWERPTYVDQMRAWNEWTETHCVGPLPSAFWLDDIVKLLFFIKLLFIKLLFFMIFI